MQEKYWTRRKGEDFKVLDGGEAHFKYVYIGCGQEVIRKKKFPPGNFYREFGYFCVKTMTRWGVDWGKCDTKIWILIKKIFILSK